MEAGTLIGARFAVEGRAGAGAMGTVYRARDRTTDRPVAVKVLRVADHEAIRRFEREATLLSGLRHPAIVSYVAHGVTAAGDPFLAMEWLDGVDLGRHLRARPPLSEEETLILAERVLDGLAAAHAAGVVHRDIKPANILLEGGAPASARLVDFGLARLIDATSSLSRSGTIIGTPAYMAPEQARGDEVDGRTDLFALGSVLHECVTGRLAFPGNQPVAVLTRILFDDPPLADIPHRLRQFLERVLAKAPDDRPRDGAAALGELRVLRRRAADLDVRAGAAVSLVEHEVAAVVLVGGEPASPLADTAVAIRAPQRRPTGLDAIATSLGARIEVLFDGVVVALVTEAPSATDLGERAAQLALELRRALPGRPIVVATGRALMQGGVPLGPVIERAWALLRTPHEADSSSIRIDDNTRDLLDARFDLTGAGEWTWLRGVRPDDDPTRMVLGRRVPFVGREREMRILDAAFEAAVAASTAELVLLTGSPGLGKSRLAREWIRSRERRGDSFALWIGRGDSMTTASPYAMLLHPLRHHANIRREDPPDRRRGRLLARAEERLGGRDARPVAVFLGELLGADFDDSDDLPLRAARQDSRLLADHLQRAWADLLAAERKDRPLVLVLEDLQWADPPTIALVDLLARSRGGQGLVVIALARPELSARFPELWPGRGLTRLELPPLSAAAGEGLLRAIVGREVGADRIARLAHSGSGNPFFLEELARAGLAGQDSTPESVLLMVQAGFAALPAESRRLLRAAAILGERFAPDGLAALVEPREAHQVPRLLDELARGDWIVRIGAGELAFRHALIREAAYGLLTEADRLGGHRRAAEWLERSGDLDPLVVAEHLEAAGELDRARAWYRRAAERALAGSDLESALALAERAIRLGAIGAELGHLHVVQAEAENWLGRYQEAEAHAARACSLIATDEATWGQAANHLQWALGARGAIDQVHELARAALDVPPTRWTAHHTAAAAWAASQLTGAGRLDDADAIFQRLEGIERDDLAREPAALGALSSARGARAYEVADLERAILWSRQAFDAYVAGGDERLASLARVNLAKLCIETGDRTAARALLEAVGENLPDLTSGIRLVLHAWLLALDGSPSAAVETARRGFAIVVDHDRFTASRLHVILAWILCQAGRHEEAVAVAGSPLARADARVRAAALAAEARCLLCLGRDDEALRLTSAAIEERGVVEAPFADVFAALVHIEALARAGRRQEAEASLAATRDLVLARAGQMTDPGTRDRFLAEVPENARVLALAAEWLGRPTRPA